MHIRIDHATDWHDHAATYPQAKGAGRARFNVATYSHFKTAIDP